LQVLNEGKEGKEVVLTTDKYIMKFKGPIDYNLKWLFPVILGKVLVVPKGASEDIVAREVSSIEQQMDQDMSTMGPVNAAIKWLNTMVFLNTSNTKQEGLQKFKNELISSHIENVETLKTFH
jgi:hypothetical protein